MKKRTNKLPRLGDCDAESGYVGKVCCKWTNCSLCLVRVPDKDHHCVWYVNINIVIIYLKKTSCNKVCVVYKTNLNFLEELLQIKIHIAF